MKTKNPTQTNKTLSTTRKHSKREYARMFM